ncbi:MAG: DegV family protein, partial [Candidatus Heimdallarchaeaceae archaeon]
MKVKIVTDSTTCLPTDFIKNEGIGIIESKVLLNDREYKELSDIIRGEFISSFPSFDGHVRTSIGSPKDALDVFEEAIADDFEEIIYIGVSPTISNQFSSAKVASKKVKNRIKVTLYECGLSSASHGALVLHTNTLLKKGKTTSEILDILGTIRKQVFTIGISPSFDLLFKTGKIQKKMSIKILSKLLKLKPMFEIVLNEGAQGFGAGLGYESAIKKAVQRLKELTLEEQEYYLIL